MSWAPFLQPRLEDAADVTHVSDTVQPSTKVDENLQSADELGAQGRAEEDDTEASSPSLSDEQQEVFELVKQGNNVFFTGNAGQLLRSETSL